MVRQLELFSGIGGMRISLEMAGVKVSEVHAYDTSPVANKAYTGIFPGSKLHCINIENIEPTVLDGVADIWTM